MKWLKYEEKLFLRGVLCEENWGCMGPHLYCFILKILVIFLPLILFVSWRRCSPHSPVCCGRHCRCSCPTQLPLLCRICSLRRLLPTPFTGSPRETGLGESAGQDRQGWRSEELWHFCGRPSSVLWPGWCHQTNWVQRMGSRCTGWRGRSEQILQGRGSWVGQEHRQWRPQHTGECGEHRRHETNKI